MNNEREGLREEMLGAFAEVYRHMLATQDEMRGGFAEANRNLVAVRDEIRLGLAGVNQALAATQDEMRQGFVGAQANLAATQGEMRQGFAETRERLDRVEGETRRQGVLLEATRDDVRAIAEGHVTLFEQIERYRQENNAAHAETRALIHLGDRDLDRRVRRLEGRPGERSPSD
jgi:hypothetical protein